MNVTEYQALTFLFADICNYTRMCLNNTPSDNVRILNTIFTEFDRLLDVYGVEKVHINGDAYITVCGNKDPQNHALKQRAFAEHILEIAKKYAIEIRIGMASGPAVSAYIGIRNPAFSFYGNTVNTAARMESFGYPMCIHISELCVRELIAEGAAKSEFVELGIRLIKGMGYLPTFLCCIGEKWKGVYESADIKYRRSMDDSVLR